MALATRSARELLEGSSLELEDAGVDTARLDTEILLGMAMGITREDLYSEPEAEVSPAAAKVFRATIRRRYKREPLAYIVGRAYFRRLELEVNRHVLIPRPETELLVELAGNSENVLDVGTGSGAVALAIADERDGVQVTATDISPTAITVSRQNAKRLDLDVHFVQEDLISGESYDLIVSNPPYVRNDEWDDLQPEIKEYEPKEALLGGEDGLDVTRRLIEAAPDALKGGGRLAVEVGVGQAGDVIEIMRDSGFDEPNICKDLAQLKRVVWAKKSCAGKSWCH